MFWLNKSLTTLFVVLTCDLLWIQSSSFLHLLLPRRFRRVHRHSCRLRQEVPPSTYALVVRTYALCILRRFVPQYLSLHIKLASTYSKSMF